MKKVTSIVLAALMLVSVLAMSSCKKADSSSTPKATISTASGDTLKDGEMSIGIDNTYPPMEYVDPESGNNIGFDIDLSKEIANRLGKKVKFIPTQWDGIFQALNTDKFDAIISSVSMSDERLQNFEFTKPYIANAQMIVVKNGDKSIKSANDLKGKTVGCQLGTTANDSATYLQETSKINFTLKTYDSVMDTFSDMKAGRLQAIIVDEVVGEYYIKQDSKTFQAASVNLTNEPIGGCFKKGNTVLKNEVQQAIDEIIKDGTMKKISQKWFGKDLTSNIDDKLKSIGE